MRIFDDEVWFIVCRPHFLSINYIALPFGDVGGKFYLGKRFKVVVHFIVALPG